MRIGDRWTVRLLGIARHAVPVGADYTVRRTGPTVAATVDRVEGGDALGFGEIAAARLRLAAPAVADPVDRCPQTARFMLCDATGEAVAAGVIEGIERGRAPLAAAPGAAP
jgi:sulfate adenylyltransferase subunit 1 (EFTu-like GTPase family)